MFFKKDFRKDFFFFGKDIFLKILETTCGVKSVYLEKIKKFHFGICFKKDFRKKFFSEFSVIFSQISAQFLFLILFFQFFEIQKNVGDFFSEFRD